MTATQALLSLLLVAPLALIWRRARAWLVERRGLHWRRARAALELLFRVLTLGMTAAVVALEWSDLGQLGRSIPGAVLMVFGTSFYLYELSLDWRLQRSHERVHHLTFVLGVPIALVFGYYQGVSVLIGSTLITYLFVPLRQLVESPEHRRLLRRLDLLSRGWSLAPDVLIGAFMVHQASALIALNPGVYAFHATGMLLVTVTHIAYLAHFYRPHLAAGPRAAEAADMRAK